MACVVNSGPAKERRQNPVPKLSPEQFQPRHDGWSRSLRLEFERLRQEDSEFSLLCIFEYELYLGHIVKLRLKRKHKLLLGVFIDQGF